MSVILWRRQSKGTQTKFFLTLATTSLIVGLITAFLPLQPGAVDMRPIVRFLEQDDRSSWRYVTFGFGDQLALLSTLTTATTIDGSYHTARTLPELRSSGIGQIERQPFDRTVVFGHPARNTHHPRLRLERKRFGQPAAHDAGGAGNQRYAIARACHAKQMLLLWIEAASRLSFMHVARGS